MSDGGDGLMTPPLTGAAAGATDDSSRTRRLPGEEGIWVLIFGDMLAFAAFFVTFLVYRLDDPALYQAGRASLDQGLGLLNTLLLLTSSWFVATAVHQARAGIRARVVPLLNAACACGVGFGVVKVFEYGAKIGAGIGLSTSDFHMFYFMFTGIHMLHVLIGLGVLAFLIVRARAVAQGAAPADAGYVATMESGGAFWHLVDLLWIVLFALFYLLD